MRIAFEAKRAFENNTGLGNYCRILFERFAYDHPQHEYYLMAPHITGAYRPPAVPNMHTVGPSGMGKLWPSAWRSSWVKSDLKRLKIDLYHGMSHEIPVGVQHTGIKSVVTMHDLIFEYYPQQYNPADVKIYRQKFRYACNNATHIIAVSKKTAEDLVELYNIPAGKITVCYPSCQPLYERLVPDVERQAVKARYRLPEKYFLSVGSIIERKNLLNICMAMHRLKDELDTPLVVIGSGNGKYAEQVRAYVAAHGMSERVIFLNDHPETKGERFRSSEDFPAIYQSADMVLFPALYEGFGLPVLEGLWSRVPVITSNTSCLPETGGDAAYYVDPLSVDELAKAILTVSSNDILRKQMVQKGIVHAQQFAPKLCAANVMKVYESL